MSLKFSLVVNGFLSVGVKAFGLLFLYGLVYRFGASDPLGLFMLYWGYVIYVHGALVLPLLHYCVSISAPSMLARMALLGWVGAGLSLLFLEEFRSLGLVLSVMLVNAEKDYYLIKGGRYVPYNFFNSFKNLFAVIGLVVGLGLKEVFYLYALGEFVKFIVASFLTSKIIIVEKGVQLFERGAGFIKYASYLLISGSYVVIVKTVLAYLDPSKVVVFESIFRVSEVIFIAVTSGLMPIYLNKMSNSETNDKQFIEKFALKVSIFLGCGGMLVVILAYSFVGLDRFGLEFGVIEFIFTTILVVVLAVLLVKLSFLRKEFALVIKRQDFLLLIVIPLVVSVSSYIYLVMTPEGYWFVPMCILILIVALFLEMLYIRIFRHTVNV